jgi:hypothetical protein
MIIVTLQCSEKRIILSISGARLTEYPYWKKFNKTSSH